MGLFNKEKTKTTSDIEKEIEKLKKQQEEVLKKEQEKLEKQKKKEQITESEEIEDYETLEDNEDFDNLSGLDDYTKFINILDKIIENKVVQMIENFNSEEEEISDNEQEDKLPFNE